jgi:hypothetical protein
VDFASFKPQATIYGVDDGDQLGHVPAVDDVDGDGLADLVLTAVSADGPGNTVDLAGEAAVVLGRGLAGDVNGVPGQVHSLVYGEDPQDRLGRSAATGDIDGDGDAEILPGAGAGSPDLAGLLPCGSGPVSETLPQERPVQQ